MFCSEVEDVNPGSAGLNETAILKILSDFESFLVIDQGLSERTVYDHVRFIDKYLRFLKFDPSLAKREHIREFLRLYKNKAVNTYANVLKSLKVFYRDFLQMEDLVRTFKFPKRSFKPKEILNKRILQKAYNFLEDPRDQVLFLGYAVTGLRRNELLGVRLENVNFEMRMIIPEKRISRTKHTWVTFYNEEVEEILPRFFRSRRDNDHRFINISSRYCNTIFQKLSRKVGERVSPQRLRDWFCAEMGELGVPDRYIDAFCGRIPSSILARHYTDYSPQRLKRIYDNAGLRVLS